MKKVFCVIICAMVFAAGITAQVSQSKYSVVVNEQNVGPYSMDTLKDMIQRGTLTKTSLVWKEGMLKWQEAGLVEELMPLFNIAPPPIPSASQSVPPPIPQSAPPPIPQAAQSAPVPVVSPTKSYLVGETGPAGGIIFYDKGIVSDGWRYLEAAPPATEFQAPWSVNKLDVSGASSTAVGTGKMNTQVLVERLRASGENGTAAQLCAGLSINGYADWFLPSKDELNLIYRNLKQKGVGGYGNGFYWSSSQYNKYYANGQRFSDGNQLPFTDYSKNSACFVRAVRAF